MSGDTFIGSIPVEILRTWEDWDVCCARCGSTLEHVVCGECETTVTLCGTPLALIARIVPPGTEFEFPPCVVCFGSDTGPFTGAAPPSTKRS